MVRSFTGPDSYQLRASSATRIAAIGVRSKTLSAISTGRRVLTSIPRVGVARKRQPVIRTSGVQVIFSTTASGTAHTEGDNSQSSVRLTL